MPKTSTRVYRVVTETPEGCYWHCVWCHAAATTPAPTWDAAVDALMEEHARECRPYQVWRQGVEQRTPQWAQPHRTRETTHPEAITPPQLTLL